MNIIDTLKCGLTVEDYREGGNSMTPIIKSRQPITLAPVLNPDLLTKGDIVLCKVNGRRYTHLITATKPGYVQISNNHGHVNGWTSWANVYGIVTHIDGKWRRNSQYLSAVTVRIKHLS